MSSKQPNGKHREVLVDQIKKIQKQQEYEAPQYPSEMQPLQPLQVIASQTKEATSYQKGQRVLDRMARVSVDQEADAPSIFSYHYEYKDYLDYYRFIDPERAKRKEELERRKIAKQLDAHLDKNIADGDESGGEEGEGAVGDSAVSGFDDGESGVQHQAMGGGRFDNLIKSLIARIEFNNTLAPIQDYGRHQKKAAQINKNKKNKKKTLGKNEQSETPSDAGAGAKQDENFYDLDDDFIDDEDIMMIEQDDDMMHDFYDQSKNQSAAQSEFPDLIDKEDGGKSDGEDTNQMDDQSFDSDKERQQKRYQKILKNFKVLMPDEVEEMLAEDFKREEQRKNERLIRDQSLQPTITTMLQNGGNQTSAFTPNPLQKTSTSSQKPKDQQYPLQSPMIGQAPVPDRTPTTAVSVKNGKKRDREEFNTGNQLRGDELGDIEQIISSLRERVLLNETLNNFKKEISQIADLVERRDPQWNQQFSSTVAQKLSQVLQKQQPQEILYMLQRNSLQEKRKKKKAEFDKTAAITKQCIERDLKQQNKKSDEDYIELPLINPAIAKFVIANDS